MTDNGFKWAEDLMIEPPATITAEVLLKEAQEYIVRLEQAVEFWKKSFNLATEDYCTLKDEYNSLDGAYDALRYRLDDYLSPDLDDDR
jgi:hypothetical protein